jgi:hypothetical protein
MLSYFPVARDVRFLRMSLRMASYLNDQYSPFSYRCLKVLAYRKSVYSWSLFGISMESIALSLLMFEDIGLPKISVLVKLN